MKKISIVLLTLTLFFGCATKEEEALTEYSQWHTITLPFEGPETSEMAEINPFLHYRLTVTFTHGTTKRKIRGFYAADGHAAESGADAGNIWQVRFTPDEMGKWTYSAELHQGDSIALHENGGTLIDIPAATGEFMVVPSDKEGADFRAHGRLVNHKGYFRFKHSGDYWMKGGADSPENLLAYADFDATYRMQSSNDAGEAKTNDTIHRYLPHLGDWEEGDPTWKNGKGKGLIGAMNYLASKGMNVVYFLTMNIMGDGKDVWPYVTPDDFTRFDVSKLDQWEILFQHMQSKGILLHMVLQETENETMLDGGDTGPMRQLYLQELVARFGHHLGLNFNLGEENGYAEFTPISQNDTQRRAMTDFLAAIDPYNHPILLHTHSHEPYRTFILDSIVGFKNLDGISLQVDKRQEAAAVTAAWKQKAADSGHPWMITMDEIGMWHTGAQADAVTPDHETLRRYVLWGTLLSGAAGVEWYFGANNRYNDLNTEDWSTRDRLWELTKHAMDFFQGHLPYWEMEANHALVKPVGGYCLNKLGEVYAVYLPDTSVHSLDLKQVEGTFEVKWYDPLQGGELQTGSVRTITGGQEVDLGNPPQAEHDWIALVRRTN